MDDPTDPQSRRRILSKESGKPPRYRNLHGKGCVLILSNSFDGCEKPLPYAKTDARVMEKLFKDILECELFQGKSHLDQTAKGMKKLLKDMAEGRKEYDYVVIVISTHGGVLPETVVKAFEENREETNTKKNYEFLKEKEAEAKDEKLAIPVFFGNDFVPIREKTMRDMFGNRNSTSMLEIPKFFILDYCRGVEKDMGSDSKAGGFSNEELAAPTCILPHASDMLVAFATHPDYIALFDKSTDSKGSYLISTVAEVFEENHRDMDVVTMLTMVNRVIKKKMEKRGKQEKHLAMSMFESSLDAMFYLVADKTTPHDGTDTKL